MNPNGCPSVAHVLWSGRVGGIERLVHDLAREQSRLGADVTVAFGQATGPFADAVRDSGLEVVDLGIRSGWDAGPAKVRAGSSALRSHDVLHVHGYNAPLASMVVKSGPHIVFTEHGNFAVRRRLGASGRLKRRLQRRFLRREVKAIAANSNFTRTRFCELYGIRQDQVNVIHNGVDFSAIPEPQGGQDEDGPLVVAYVGRLVAFKRVDQLLLAAVDLRDMQVELRIIGDGPLRGELEALAARLGLAADVRFLGYRRDLDAALEGADVQVQPTGGEPFGLAIVEACARGLLPVVFADGGGALEVIPPDGEVVTDPAELAATLRRLPSSSALTPEACSERSAWARDRFPIERTAREYLELYRSALGS